MSSNRLSLLVNFVAADKLSGALRNIIDLGRNGSKSIKELTGESRKLENQLKAVRREIGSASGNVSQLVNRERELERQIAETNRAIERRARLDAIEGDRRAMLARGEDLRQRGQENIAQGATLAAPLILAVAQAGQFSSGMVDIQQKAELSNADTAQMARNILAAAQAAHQMPEAMRSGVDTLAGLGMKPTEAAQIIGTIGRVGTAFKVDLADGAQSAYANINNLKIGLGQTGKALDIMAAGGNAGAFEMRDMAKFFPGLTAQAQALGQSGLGAVADLTAALQIARRATGTADEAGNNVQNLLAKINSPTVIAAFQKKFGVDLPAAMKAAYAQGKTPMEALAEVTNKALGGDLGKLGFVVEDMQAQSALRALILNMDDYRKMRSDIANAGGTTDKAFRQRELQDASVAWSSFKGTLSALAITLGTTLLPVATEFFGYLNTGIGAVSRWAQANPEAARSLMTLAAGLGAARVGFGVLQYAIGSIIGPVATMWGWYSKLKTIGAFAGVASRAAQAFGVLRTAAIFLGQGMLRAGLMMLANPMVLIIAGIVAAIALAAYLIYANWDKIKAAFTAGVAMIGQAWGWIKQTFNAGVAFLRGLPGQMLTIGMNIVQGIARGIMAAPGAVWNALKGVVMSGITGAKNLLGIKSPSRVFMGIGGYITEGLAGGIDRGARRPVASVGRMAAMVAAAGVMGQPALASGMGDREPLAARRGAGGAAPTYHITINQQPGQNAQELMEELRRMLDDRDRRSRLSSYQDDF